MIIIEVRTIQKLNYCLFFRENIRVAFMENNRRQSINKIQCKNIFL